MRKRAAKLIGDNLVVEKVALTFPLKGGGEEVKVRPYAYISDLWAARFSSCWKTMTGKQLL